MNDPPELRQTVREAFGALRTHLDKLPHPPVVVDAGCGRGTVLGGLLREHVPQAALIGVDINGYARQNSQARYFLINDLASLCFKAAACDVIMSAWVLEHIPDYQKVIHDCYQVLRKGGICIFLVPNPRSAEGMLAKLTPLAFHKFINERLLGCRHGSTFPVFYAYKTMDNLGAAFKETGFRKVKISAYPSLSFRFRNRPMLANLAETYDRLLRKMGAGKWMPDILALAEK